MEDVYTFLTLTAWALVSFAFFVLARKNAAQKSVMRVLQILGIYHILTPALVDVWVTSIPIPATYGIYGYGLSLVVGDFSIFKASQASSFLFPSVIAIFVLFIITIVSVFFILDLKSK